MDTTAIRNIGPYDSWQVALTADPWDMVNAPVSFKAGTHTMQYHNGPTIANPKLVMIFFGQWWGNRAQMEKFGLEVMEYGYLSKLTYAVSPQAPQGCSGGKFLGAFDGTALAAGSYLDSQIRSLLKNYLAANPRVPQPDGSTIYSMFFPDNITVQFDGTSDSSCQRFCAYHSGEGNILYTVQTTNTCSGCNQGDAFAGATMTLAHEIAETTSDPTGAGYYEDATGMENGDIVAWIALKYGSWTVQGYADLSGNNVFGDWQAPQSPPPGGPPPGGPPPPPPPPIVHTDADLYAPLSSFHNYIIDTYYQNDPSSTASLHGWDAWCKQELKKIVISNTVPLPEKMPLFFYSLCTGNFFTQLFRWVTRKRPCPTAPPIPLPPQIKR